jgi:hypothetical protein
MHPIDTIKAKLQVVSMPKGVHGGSGEINAPHFLKGYSVIKQITEFTTKSEGIRGLYKGFGIHVFGSMPAGALYYGGYEFFKSQTL